MFSVVLNPVRLSQGDHHRRLLPFLKCGRRQGHFLPGAEGGGVVKGRLATSIEVWDHQTEGRLGQSEEEKFLAEIKV